MKFKKALALALCGAVTLGMLGGCSQKEKKDGKDSEKEAKGGYVEEEMEGPWGEKESYLGSYLNEDGKLEVYTQTGEVSPQVFSYTHQGGSDWEKKEENWVEEKINDSTYVYYLLQGADKNLYLMTCGITDTSESGVTTTEEGEISLPPQPWYLYRHTQEGETQEIPVECLDMEYQQQNGGFAPYYLGAAQNGDIALVGVASSNIVLYDGTTGKEKYTLPSHQIVTNNDGMINITGNTIATISEDQKNLLLYDGTTGKETGKIKVENMEAGTGFLAATGDGTYYIATEKRISVYKENGSIGEQIYDGSRGNMGEMKNSLTMKNFMAGGEKNFYAAYDNYQTGTFHICHYYYNAAASTKTEKTLSLYGLYESRMVEAAVRAFEKKHPEVDVDYQYALKQDAEGKPEDYIDALNTSLLNKEGADVLFLDDLPVDSYIEKGILEDLTDLADKGENDNTLLKGIVDGAKKDGKNYEIPASFRLPVFYGTKEAMARLDSLDSVKKFLQEQPEGKIIGAASYGQMAYLLFASNYEELRQEDGSFSEEKIQELLEMSKQLVDNNPSEDMEESWGSYFKGRILSGNTMSAFSGIGMLELYEETDIAGVDDLTGLAEISLLCDILKKQPELSVENPHNMYLSMNRMGINASSREKELAEEFIQTMLSDEIQQQEFVEGLPVRTESLEKQADIAEKSGQEEMFSISYGGGETHSYGYPSREQLEPILALAKKAETPLVIDLSVRETFIDCAEQYFGGSISAEEAAQTLGEKMQLYLSE